MNYRIALPPLICLMVLAPIALKCEKQGRDAWQEPERVLKVLDLRKGAVLADLGAGYGYFTFRLSRGAGPTGRVYAVDVSKPRLRHLRKEARKKNRAAKNARVIVVRGNARSSGLPRGKIHLVLTVNTYHHLENRIRYFRRLKQSLRKGGRVAIIDYRPKDERYSGHSIERAVILREMAAAGYRLQREFKFLEKQNFLVYTPR